MLTPYYQRLRADLERFGGTVETLVTLDARPVEGEGMASGDVVNTAARLQSAAPVNGVWHTFAVRWDETAYVFYVDATELWRTSNGLSSTSMVPALHRPTTSAPCRS